MKILIMGSGAVGGFFGARLAQAGHDVIFVARGAHLEALRRTGLQLLSVDGDALIAPVRATDDPAGAGPCDLVFVCVKSYDTTAAAAALGPAVGEHTIVLSLQNGVENEALLQQGLGIDPLMGALTHISAELEGPGVIRHIAGGRLVFGEFDGCLSPRAQALQALLTGAGVRHHLSRHIAVALWNKLSWNAAFNATTAVTRSTVGDLLAQPDGRTLVREAMLEVVHVARALGIALDPARVDEEIERSRTRLGATRTSMLQDRERGKRLESDALNGAVVRAGARSGVPTPVNRTLLALTAFLDANAEELRRE